jgi:hypothetical protein
MAPHMGRGYAPKFRLGLALPKADLTMTPIISHHAEQRAALEARLFEAFESMNDHDHARFRKIVGWAFKLQLPAADSSLSSQLGSIAWQHDLMRLGDVSKRQVYATFQSARVLAETHLRDWMREKGEQCEDWIIVNLQNCGRGACRLREGPALCRTTAVFFQTKL